MFVAIIICLLLFSPAIVDTNAKTITVGEAGEYRSIQQGIDRAGDGDTVLVGSGTYHENLNVNKQLIIKGIDDGNGYPIVCGNGPGCTIGIRSGGTRIEGLRVTGTDSKGTGIGVYSDGNTILGCVVSGNRLGIQVSDSRLNTITSNDLSDNYIGIDLNRSDNNMIADNVVNSNSFHGLKLYASAGNSILDNVACYNSDDAISLEQASDNNLISGNNVSFNALSSIEFENKNAISIYLSDGNVVSNNLLKLNGGTVARDGGAHIYRLGDGVQLKNTRDCVVKDNVMIDDHYAVWIDDSENATVTGNTASGEYYNIIVENSRDCLVADNVLSNGGRNLRLLNAHHCTLRNNTMSGGMYDITLTDSWYNTIENCTWGDSAPGYQSLWLSNSSYNTLTRNTAHDNGRGIWLESSANNRLYLNDFLDGIYSASQNNFWSTPGPETYQYNGRTYTGYLGNRYGDYGGHDVNGDGLGEIPYTQNGVADQYPLTGAVTDFLIPPPVPEPSPTSLSTPGPVVTPEPASPDLWQWLGMQLKTWLQYLHF
ncbi:right-handed parallel beta-helix repeat-containing protein [Methanocella sp. MCL-LM]|uniref:right-handed parallel beta-helix repeat-containing protein n=1 Tax=Methanocella sp. MCL-LM TaxID=3412035 RepID=UPI003C79437D